MSKPVGLPVVLRNSEFAYVRGRTQAPDPFSLIGQSESGRLELWREDGRWREDGTDHCLDIVAVALPGGGYGTNLATLKKL